MRRNKPLTEEEKKLAIELGKEMAAQSVAIRLRRSYKFMAEFLKSQGVTKQSIRDTNLPIYKATRNGKYANLV